jgi:hypothetical protein
VLFEVVNILPVKRLALTIASDSGPTKPSCNRRFTRLMAGLDGVLHCLRCGRWHTGWPRETRTSSNSCLTADIALAASASESGKGLLCALLPEGPSQEDLEEPVVEFQSSYMIKCLSYLVVTIRGNLSPESVKWRKMA